MIELQKAKAIAVEVGNKLFPYCDRLNIAGSIRRSKPEVHDIEIVCLAKRVASGQVDIFSGESDKEAVHPEFVKVVNSLGKIIKGKPDGRMMQIELEDRMKGVKSIMLDLFMPQPHDYYRQYAVRTGSSDYSRKVLAEAWVKKGWRGTEDGLRLEIECVGNAGPDGKIKWRCISKEPTLPPAWKSEPEFFDWLNIQYIPPNIRFV